MTIEWQMMEFWPPKKRAPGEEFLFWQPEVIIAPTRPTLRARSVVDSAPPGSRETVAWARINPPPTSEDAAKARLLAALRLLEGRYYLANFLAGPAKAAERAAILTALAGAPVPKSRAGLTALKAALYAAVDVASKAGRDFTDNKAANVFAQEVTRLIEKARD